LRTGIGTISFYKSPLYFGSSRHVPPCSFLSGDG
jgi:hypothetical protein